MRIAPISALLGLTAFVAVSAPLSAQAAALTYQLDSGITSVNLDTALLSSVGLTLTGAQEVGTPAPGFAVGFDILPRSTDPDILGTSFTFSFDSVTGAFAPLAGTIEHSGSVLFEVAPSLAQSSPLQVGDFSIGFEDGFFLRDEFSTGLRLFDLAVGDLSLEDGELTVSKVDLLVSEQFSDALVAAGAPAPINGVKVGSAQINAQASKVPEPGTLLAILAAASTALVLKRRQMLS